LDASLPGDLLTFEDNKFSPETSPSKRPFGWKLGCGKGKGTRKLALALK
jgi:hypothetical protein